MPGLSGGYTASAIAVWRKSWLYELPRRLDSLCVHKQVVHRPVRLYPMLADQRGQLGIVTDAVHQRMHQDRLPRSLQFTHAASGELHWLGPVIGGVAQDAAEQLHRSCVRGEHL